VDIKRGAASVPPQVQQKTAQPGIRSAVETAPAPTQQQPVATPPVAAPPQQQVQQVQQAPPPQPAGPSAAEVAKRAELKKVSDALDMLQARAGTIHSKLNNLERQQQAKGLGLRSDWVTARSLMDQFLKRAESAINAGDPVAAKDAFDKAERQVEILEK